MRLSRLFGNTLRELPSDIQLESHKLLLRAGMIRQLASGVYSYLPLGFRVLKKIEAIIREEMNKIDGQEILMPVIIPADLWKETNRYYEIGPELVRFKDRTGREMVLGMTHEEVVTDLARGELFSYKQLPFMLYQIQTKIRDEPRPRGGLIRVREFIMKDAYSFHRDFEDLDSYYPKVYQAYENIFRRCGLKAIAVEADPGMMGGSVSHEFMALVPSGEDTVVKCSHCDYAANMESASFGEIEYELDDKLQEVKKVQTIGKKTIEEVANFLGVPPSKTLKAVFYSNGKDVIFVIIRGDFEVNLTKLMNLLKEPELHLATEDELKRVGIVAGFASPIDLPENIKIVADRSIKWGNNFVAGANEVDYHLTGVNYPRDFKVDIIGDFAKPREGDPCPKCGKPLKIFKGIELGHIFKLGTKYSDAMNLEYQDEEGKKCKVVMGCYGIGLGRLMAAVVEQFHDKDGIIWPLSIAPYQVHLICLTPKDNKLADISEKIYQQLTNEDIEVLYDDRNEGAGVKFKDADLIGIPIRLVISYKSIAKGGVEFKLRENKKIEIIELDKIVEFVKERIKELSINYQ